MSPAGLDRDLLTPTWALTTEPRAGPKGISNVNVSPLPHFCFNYSCCVSAVIVLFPQRFQSLVAPLNAALNQTQCDERKDTMGCSLRGNNNISLRATVSAVAEK